jgi:hypothetical protein
MITVGCCQIAQETHRDHEVQGRGRGQAGGFYSDGSGHAQALVASEVSGKWRAAIEVPGSATLNADGNAEVNAVSCAAAGTCVAGGFYADSSNNDQAFVVSQR